MIYFLLVPVFSLALVVFQASFLEAVLFNSIGIEITLLCVIYAGLYLDVLRGVYASFFLGLIMDCLTSPVSGLFSLVYVLIFFIAIQVAPRVYKAKLTFVIAFTFSCAVLEALMLITIYELIFGASIPRAALSVYLPQAVITGLLGPGFFSLFCRIKDSLNVRDTRTT
jgi:rod shape-determining protein MreD